jgi:hypothetical protein
MTTRQALIDDIIRFRLGKWSNTSAVSDFAEVHEFIKNDRLTSAIAVYDAGRRRVLPLNEYDQRLIREEDLWSLRHLKWGSDNRIANFCSYLDSMNMTGTFVMSLTDGAYWSFNQRSDTAGYPIIQFARDRDDSGAVLFPLDHKYMGVGSVNLPLTIDEIDIPFDRKKDMAVWRGRLSGTTRRNGGTSYAEKLIPSLLAARTEEEFSAIIQKNLHHKRILLCERFSNDPDFDVAITGPGAFYYDESLPCMQWPSARRLLGPRKSVREQLEYRYILCVAGNDFPSGLYWALASNSVVLMPDPVWRTPLDFGLEAWTHFVPVAEDFSDLRQKLEWCRSHRTEVQEIVQRAKAYCRTLCDVELRDVTDRAVVGFYESLVRRTPRPKPISFASDAYLSEVRMHVPPDARES